MRLVEITSTEKSTAHASVSDRINTRTWIGLTCPTGGSNCQWNFSLWTWDYSKRNLTETEGWHTRFVKNGEFIKGGGLGENCAHWWKSPGHWGPQSCSSTHYGTLCEEGNNGCKYYLTTCITK